MGSASGAASCATATRARSATPPRSWKRSGTRALWIPDVGGDVFGALRDLLDATTTIVAATGILNLWMHAAAEVGEGFAALDADHPGRTLLGIGVSHSLLIDQTHPGEYAKPLQVTRTYLDELDAVVAHRARRPAGARRARARRCSELARDRAGGAHPYLVTPEHTAGRPRGARRRPAAAPRAARRARDRPRHAPAPSPARVSRVYLQLPNYVNNWRRLGFGEDDFADGGSDRLIDHVVVWGDEATIAARVQAHFDAGADHVCVQAYTGAERTDFPRAEWRALAPALVGLTRR